MKSVRQMQISKLVDQKEAVTVGELGQLLDVSEATIRRDLDSLAVDGAIIRTHGGAVSMSTLVKEQPLLERRQMMGDAKASIAKRAAALVGPGETIFLGSGTTVALVAAHLAGIPNLTVITNSLPVVEELRTASDIDLIIIGGEFRASEQSMVGLKAVEAIRGYRADRVLMGIRAIDVAQGFTGDAIDEAMTDRAIIEIGRQSVVLADHSKFGSVSTVFLAPVRAVDVVVTDAALDRVTAEAVADAGLQLIIAEGDQ